MPLDCGTGVPPVKVRKKQLQCKMISYQHTWAGCPCHLISHQRVQLDAVRDFSPLVAGPRELSEPYRLHQRLHT
ncbi:MAG: hypothetical protein JWM21_46 [Acidobacteria bacterium]|nr:hypothetical protein [Acidobacteriota bacterium]